MFSVSLHSQMNMKRYPFVPVPAARSSVFKLCVNPIIIEFESLFHVHASCCWGTWGPLAPSDVLELPRADAHQQMESDCTALSFFYFLTVLSL